jgi:hypothetical protein
MLREDPGGGGPQLLLGARRGHGAVAQVVADVEVGIVDPDGLAHSERDETHLLAVARREVELALDHRPQVLEGRRRSLEDADAADVHGCHVVLDVQEHRILGAHRLDAATSVRSSRPSSCR